MVFETYSIKVNKGKETQQNKRETEQKTLAMCNVR